MSARDYHWSPVNQREFLLDLAANGSVERAARCVGMSTRAAYDLRHRREGVGFRLGWAAALLLARDALADRLLDQAMYGYEEQSTRESMPDLGHAQVTRRRHSPALGIAMLARLDRMADPDGAAAGELALAQLIASDFNAYLDRLGDPLDGGTAFAVAAFLAGHGASPLRTLWADTPIAREVAQFSAPSDDALDAFENPTNEADDDDDEDADDGDEDEGTPDGEARSFDLLTWPVEEAAGAMRVWYDEDNGGWRTNFPPAEADSPFRYESSARAQASRAPFQRFGSWGYSRALTASEEVAQERRLTARLAPYRAAAARAREAWFAAPTDATDGMTDGAADKTTNGAADGMTGSVDSAFATETTPGPPLLDPLHDAPGPHGGCPG